MTNVVAVNRSPYIDENRPGSLVRLPDSGEPISAAWVEFIRFCSDLGHGEIERLIIQDGLPVLAEMTKKKVKFTR